MVHHMDHIPYMCCEKCYSVKYEIVGHSILHKIKIYSVKEQFMMTTGAILVSLQWRTAPNTKTHQIIYLHLLMNQQHHQSRQPQLRRLVELSKAKKVARRKRKKIKRRNRQEDLQGRGRH